MFVNQDSISIIQDSVIDSIIQDNVIPSIIQDSVVDSIIQDRDICICCRCVALDETTVVTNRVIVAAGLIGGPSERSLPPLSPSLNPYPCPLVTDHPLPECFHGNTVALETQLETGIIYTEESKCVQRFHRSIQIVLFISWWNQATPPHVTRRGRGLVT